MKYHCYSKQRYKTIKIPLTKIIIVLVFGLAFLTCKNRPKTMQIIFAGDVILDRGVNDKIKMYGDSILVNSLLRFNRGDYFCINYEGTFTESTNKSDKKFTFKTAKKQAKLLKAGGVTHVSVANNHGYDFGNQGFIETIGALEKNDLTIMGNSLSPTILSKGDYKCAILSASLTSNSDSFPLSSIGKLLNAVNEFKTVQPSIPLVIYIHWGLELQPKPANWQKEAARSLIEAGANAIIGHHPHVIQSMEFINNCPVFYSVGNFVADAYLDNTTEGLVVNLGITKHTQPVTLQPISLATYFPKQMTDSAGNSAIIKILRHSQHICVIKKGGVYHLSPNKNINFNEKDSPWFFANNGIVASLKKLQSGSYLLNTYNSDGMSNGIALYGIVSDLQIADINNDGFNEILVCIEKKVHFDPVNKKRINIFTCTNNNLKALWLGTKFIHDIESFSVENTDNYNYLKTKEKDQNGKSTTRIYEWDEFGFSFVK